MKLTGPDLEGIGLWRGRGKREHPLMDDAT